MRMSNSMGILHKIFAILLELEMNTKLTRLVHHYFPTDLSSVQIISYQLVTPLALNF